MRLCGNFNKPIPRKVVICGDGACGKTSLLNVFMSGLFPHSYEPTVFENYIQELTIDGEDVVLSMWDTAGQEEFDRLRAHSYKDTHVIMLCFSIDNPDSLENIANRWLSEIQQHCPQAKIVLVALKCDLRDTKTSTTPVLYEQGLEVARRINAVRYLECSAKHNRGVRECFQQAARVSLTVNNGKKSHYSRACIIT
ncbi:small GTPase superfamily [Phycomyces blakesleeanus]|uniref:Uncharacterized protein n=2 Tax=Phycomyces blakesleeanus TaxID=4837 RepID=A0A163A6P0_PHYB8|nr:hypothetical protein PHYBLDRAFT_57424 [Phycomyces blakesleeanus NRRL 1555(-)]OAD71441.1 hypothetical protein PHYBLDRAFT_57424 [Phycomyces blakesleeanus NRRL 1555(-)]|eukprot:XP_018289481.1 hypothetical protein PHYBLDRAFT_57424 [Phycomyces blakesleeanus NRRL 1555(-)]